MADTQLGAVIQKALQQLSTERQGGLPDSQLLERFLTSRDEAAFETLLWRHGPMVLATCRRILHQAQDAEDAFQATFLVLCRKAHSLRKLPSCGAWLYRVAYHLALKARSKAARRSAVEQQVPARSPTAPADDVLWRDLRPVLDDEVNRLPEKYRTVLVLHYLEGKTIAQVAEELGWLPGTVSGRLARARDLLRGRLTRRGLGLAGIAPLTAVLVQHASAGGLPSASVQLAVSAAREGTRTLSPTAITLANGMVHTMMLTKLRTAGLLLLAATVLVLGVGIAADRVAFAPPRADLQKPRQVEQPQAEQDLTPDPKSLPNPLPVRPFGQLQAYPFRCIGGRRASSFGYDGDQTRSVIFSPDGKRMGFVEWKIVAGVGWVLTFHLQETTSGKDLWTKGRFSALGFSPDGKLLAGSESATVHLFAAATGNELRSFTIRDEVDPPKDDIFLPNVDSFAFSPDGKMLAVVGHIQRGVACDINPESITPLFHLWEVTTGKFLQQVRGKKGSFFHLVGFSSEGVPPPKRAGIHQWRGALVEEVGLGQTSRALTSPSAWSADGKTRASLEMDGTIKLSGGVLDEEAALPHKHENNRVNSLTLSPDGRSVVSGGMDGRVCLWESATGKLRWEAVPEKDPDQDPERPNWINSVSFSPDGTILLAYRKSFSKMGHGIDKTFLWRLTGERKPAPTTPLSARELETLWVGLADADAGIAYRAIVTLIAAPEQAVKFLGSRSRLLSAPHQRVVRLLANLDADEFTVREKASAELAKMGEAVKPLLRQALRRQSSPEVRLRLNLLLDQMRTSDSGGELLRGVRAVEVLETVGTPEARAVLKALSTETPRTWLTDESVAALQRLARHMPKSR